PYSRRLSAHKSCVNALKFSCGEGRFLASGGDDLGICLWDFYQDDVKQPSYTLRGPTRNIFTLEFSANNKYLLVGGSSDVVLKYDVATLGSSVESFNRLLPDQTYHHHDDSVRIITCHPYRDEIFMSGGEDGTIQRFDVRQSRRSDVVDLRSEVTGAQYHPRAEHLFVSSDHRGNVCLWDARMSFGRSRTSLKLGEGIVRRYNTRLTRQDTSWLSNPEASSVVFDREGIFSMMSSTHYFPTIYAVSDADPAAILKGNTLPDGSPIPEGERKYTNSCTMKHGSFGGFGLGEDLLYGGGSDDFRAYIWRISSISDLLNQREIQSAKEWTSTRDSRIAFCDRGNRPKVLPVQITKPTCRLSGHDSIVNSVVFHPHFLHVVTAGVERRIVLHSPTPSSPCTQDLALSSTNVRSLTAENSDLDRLTYLSALADDESIEVNSETIIDQNESRTLGLFDHLLREEGEPDVFLVRRLSQDSDSDNSDSESQNSTDGGMEADNSDEDLSL
ncbi:WD40-repeat-containing domain protein, partial [Crepidotus variabilis]